jgi:hypothetical protein
VVIVRKSTAPVVTAEMNVLMRANDLQFIYPGHGSIRKSTGPFEDAGEKDANRTADVYVRLGGEEDASTEHAVPQALRHCAIIRS